MREILIESGQMLKKKEDENGNCLCWWERIKKGCWEILPHLPWFD